MVINSSLSNLTYVTYRTVHNKKGKPSEETVPFIKKLNVTDKQANKIEHLIHIKRHKSMQGTKRYQSV